LQEVNLTLTPVNDDALQHLAGLSELRVLGLASTQCTGTGFSHLRGLQQLENVNFHFTPLNDDGLRAITQVPIADRFWFAHTRFTDAGAASLSSLRQLKRCGIGSTDSAGSAAGCGGRWRSCLWRSYRCSTTRRPPRGWPWRQDIATLRRLDVTHAANRDRR
jgi:hypothetical protein